MDLSLNDFGSWLRPREVLSKLVEAKVGVSEDEILARIVRGRIRMAGRKFSKAGDEWIEAPRSSLISPAYLDGSWHADWGEFWISSQVTFVLIPIPLPSAARRIIVRPGGSLGQRIVTPLKGSARPNPVASSESFLHSETQIFRDVRLDPVTVANAFDLDPPLETLVLQQEGLPRVRSPGRAAGMHG